jgi:hypothetical protein
MHGEGADDAAGQNEPGKHDVCAADDEPEGQ